MLRNYELTVVIRPDLAEDDLAAVLSNYEGKITADAGSIFNKDVWGTKRFSYPVKKYFRGYYVCYEIATDPKVIKDIEHEIRFDDRVLRHIVIGVPELTSVSQSTEQTPDGDGSGEQQTEGADAGSSERPADTESERTTVDAAVSEEAGEAERESEEESEQKLEEGDKSDELGNETLDGEKEERD